jgi:hypothetical protein
LAIFEILLFSCPVCTVLGIQKILLKSNWKPRLLEHRDLSWILTVSINKLELVGEILGFSGEKTNCACAISPPAGFRVNKYMSALGCQQDFILFVLVGGLQSIRVSIKEASWSPFATVSSWSLSD